ncbi:uncharacterized protein LOC106172764 [Lingula anatina]|uniref:glucosamine-phosphate N-acetyltransferase n=1 Tax=Lingula anatina TaxID=7574 RepID=A0A1S3JFA8_LINAN|nr:uncharacterized protein LOC106172764 [Lingula anatina]|eukprot:XP_013409097.1 uncharacterized protein LOC106172764 [Lingula anatina]
MAAAAVTSRLSPVDFSPEKNTEENDAGNEDPADCSIDSSILSGAKFAESQAFKNKKGKHTTVTPLIIDFRRLLQSSKLGETIDIIPGVPNKELLHAVVGLYSVSLSEMTPDVLYSTVCEKWARTIVLIRDIKDVLEDFEIRRQKKRSETNDQNLSNNNSEQKEAAGDSKKTACSKESGKKKDKSDKDDVAANGEIEKEDSEKEDIYEVEEDKPSIFAPVFSDSEDEEEEEESDEEEEDYSKGINHFLQLVQERKKIRDSHEGSYDVNHVGIENRLVACATFEKKFCKPGERVVHLTLVAVRQRYRKHGIGKYLIQQIKDQSVVGQYDAIVVHADNSAIDFFERYGFSDDVVLNSRWDEFAEQFTQCTLMSYLPPFTTEGVLGNKRPELDILLMELEIKKWRHKSLEAYQAEISCMNRLRSEIIHLRALVTSQQDLISSLVQENESLGHEKFMHEREFLEYRLAVAKAAVSKASDDNSGDEGDISVDQLIADMEKELQFRNLMDRKESDAFDGGFDSSRYVVTPEGGTNEPYDHGRDIAEFHRLTEDFKAGIGKDKDMPGKCEVTMISKTFLTQNVHERYEMRLQHLKDPTFKMRLYFCGSLEHPERIQEIMKNGFSEEDFSHGEYGRGLYFSQFPSKAAQFSALGKMILAEVALGKTESVLKKDRARVFPPRGFDSIVVPGRLAPSEGAPLSGTPSLNQEYVIFDANQAVPLNMIEFTTTA